MNAKLVKAMRRFARAAQLPEQTTYLQHTQRGTIIVNPTCFRGFYRSIKRHYREG